MTLIFGNLWYFLAMMVAATVMVILYFTLEKRSQKTQKIVLFSLLIVALISYNIRVFFMPKTNEMFINLFPILVFSACLLTFPIHFWTKNQALRDSLFYFGLFVGALAIIYPTSIFGLPLFSVEVITYYISAIIIFSFSLLWVLLGLQKLDYKRIWRMPFLFAGFLVFILANTIIAGEIFGVDPKSLNDAMVWLPKGDISKAITIFTPSIFETLPTTGVKAFWPLIYLLPSVFIYGLALPFIMCLPFEGKHIFSKKSNKKAKNNGKHGKNKTKKDIIIKSQDFR